MVNLNEDERIFRYAVPVDDDWHEHELWGSPLAVACRDPRFVEFWARSPVSPGPDEFPARRRFRVFGTGHPLAAGIYRGTAVAPGGALVWHLLEERP